jgi:hypothetical protein
MHCASSEVCCAPNEVAIAAPGRRGTPAFVSGVIQIVTSSAVIAPFFNKKA